MAPANSMERHRRLLERYGYVTAVAAVVLATALFLPGRPHFAKGQWALLYLVVVVGVASVSGIRPALVAAALSFLAWNFFFIPPYNTFNVADPRDWLMLFVFLAVGLLMGWQTGRLREREAQALEREQETALLNRFSARLVSGPSVEEVAETLVQEVLQVTQASCAALFLSNESGEAALLTAEAGGPECHSSDVRHLVTWANREAKAIGLPPRPNTGRPTVEEWPISARFAEADVKEERRDLVLPLQTATRQSGVLYVGPSGTGTAYNYAQVRPVVALANQVSVFLERMHLQTLAMQAEALQEADRMKSTLVSAVSHELKTPLASLTATITGLLEGDVPWEEARARQELAAVAQDLARLGESISSLLDLSRLEASEWRPHLEQYELGEILGTTLSRFPPGQRDRISVALPEDLPSIRADFDQWVRVLEHLLGNALLYSGPGSPVRVGASADPSEVRMWVEDEGPGVRPEERSRVFDKFYRGKAATTASGTGIGLAISSEVVRFHGGRIWIEDVVPHGARFVVALPRAEGDGTSA
jgi:two-component system sensor histidine kinase KdpD